MALPHQREIGVEMTCSTRRPLRRIERVDAAAAGEDAALRINISSRRKRARRLRALGTSGSDVTSHCSPR